MPPGSVSKYHWKLGSKQAYHAMPWPCTRGLAVSAGVWLRANETEISAAQWAREAREKLYFITFTSTWLRPSTVTWPCQVWQKLLTIHCAAKRY